MVLDTADVVPVMSTLLGPLTFKPGHIAGNKSICCSGRSARPQRPGKTPSVETGVLLTGCFPYKCLF